MTFWIWSSVWRGRRGTLRVKKTPTSKHALDKQGGGKKTANELLNQKRCPLSGHFGLFNCPLYQKRTWKKNLFWSSWNRVQSVLILCRSQTLKWSFSSADGGIETMKVASSLCNRDESGASCCSFNARSGFDAACWNSQRTGFKSHHQNRPLKVRRCLTYHRRLKAIRDPLYRPICFHLDGVFFAF